MENLASLKDILSLEKKYGSLKKGRRNLRENIKDTIDNSNLKKTLEEDLIEIESKIDITRGALSKVKHTGF